MRTPPSLTPADSPMSSSATWRLDHLVEPDLVQVDVEQPGTHGIELVLLQHCVMRGLLAVEDDVEDRVEAVLSREDAAKLALLDGERVRRSCRRRRGRRERIRRARSRRATALPASSRGLTSSLIRSPAISAGKCS